MHQDNLLKFLDHNLFITLHEAKKIGINPMMLSRLTAKEAIFRTEHGVYTHDLSWLTDPLKKYTVACQKYPKAVICCISALTYYDLTDEEERQIWVSIPASNRIENPKYRVIRPSGLSYSLGIQTYHFGKRVVRIYDIEKTVVDAFKYHTLEVAMKSLKGYMKRKDKNVQKLCDTARRLKKPLDDIVTAIWADE